MVSLRLHAKNDKETITAWRLDLDEILQVFDVRSTIRAKVNANLSLPGGTRNEHKSNRLCRSPTVLLLTSDIRDHAVNTRTTVSDIHSGGLKRSKGMYGSE